MNKYKKIGSLFLLVLILFFPSFIVRAEKIILKVFHAGSLAVPFSYIEKAFEKKYPYIDVRRESSGSVRAVRKVTDLHKPCDVVASADYSLISDMMFPKYTEYVKLFAKNELVIAYTEKSKFAEKINSSNWFEILAKEGVKFGFSNPNLDPCGYRAIIMLVLSELYYKKPIIDTLIKPYLPFKFIKNQKKVIIIIPKIFSPKGKKIFIRPKEIDLLGLLEGGAIDYLIIYRSVALQHNLKFIKLPEKVNLGSEKYTDIYKNITIVLGTGKKVKGKPIIYGITALKTAPHPKEAKLFENFVTSRKGAELIKKAYQIPVYPAIEIKYQKK